MIQCNFCKTRHIIQSHPYPCFAISPRQKKYEGLQIFYVPYWRFKGLEFRLGGQSPDFRVIDHSFLAVDIDGLPASLGLRSQTQRLKFIRKDMLGSFLPPSLSRKDIRKQIAGGVDQKIHIGEILSLIFMPFYQDTDIAYDGLSGKALDINLSELKTNKKSPAIRLEFTPSLCPNCGWDLNGKADSLVLSCSNCMRFWLIHHKKLNPIRAMEYGNGPQTDMQMPFWRLRVEFKNLDCSTVAHLIKMANLPKVIQAADEAQPLYFYIPAFKINPKLFLRISRQTTLAQVEPSQMPNQLTDELHPADLALEEGFQAVLPLLMELCIHKKETWHLLKTEKLKLTSFNIVYLSFRASGSELIQDTLGVSLPLNSLRFGRNL